MADDHITNLHNAGFSLLPLKTHPPEKRKQPRDQNWQTNEYDLPDLGPQVGLRLKPGLIDVDVEWPEARTLLPTVWPRELRNALQWGVLGETTHMVFQCDDIRETVKFKLNDKVKDAPKLTGDHGNLILEVRATKDTGAQAMIPPSVHPNGNLLRWRCSPDNLPPKLDAETLLAAAGKLAGAAALLRSYPSEGGRDEFCMALAGMAINGGWTEDAVEELIDELASWSNDEEHCARTKKVAAAAKRLAGGKEVAGIKMLSEAAGIPIQWAQQIAIWMGWRKSGTDGQTGPVVHISDVLDDMVQQSWGALSEYEIGGDPGLYTRGGVITRLNGDRLQPVSRDMLRNELGRAATFVKHVKDKDGNWKAIRKSPPVDVASGILSDRMEESTLPEIRQVTTVPVITKDGRLLNQSGFDHDSGIFCALEISEEVPEVPTSSEVREALRTVWEPLSDFPFEDRSDKVHALCMCLEPYLRDMIGGNTPLYFINKPQPGAGASLLVTVALYPSLGKFPGMQTPPQREEEMQKWLLALMADGSPAVVLDNVNRLDSAALASALTSESLTGRVLGASQIGDYPVACQWIGTGINSGLSPEIYRRTVDIRIDPQMSSPEDRKPEDFRIPHLERYVVEHRGKMVRASLILIQHWVAQEMPKGTAPAKGSFFQWSEVMGGIMASLNIRGFGETPADRKPSDPQEEAVIELIQMWRRVQRSATPLIDHHWKEYDFDPEKPLQAKQVLALCEAEGLDDIVPEHGDRRKHMAALLQRFKDRPFDGVDAVTREAVQLTIRVGSYGSRKVYFVEQKGRQVSDA